MATDTLSPLACILIPPAIAVLILLASLIRAPIKRLLNRIWWWKWRRDFRKAALWDIANSSGPLRSRQELARHIGVEVPHD
jgi:hypothetical protein